MPKRKTKPRAEALRIDLGPDIRHQNGTAIRATRADPAAPHAPALSAAKAFIRYEHMGLEPGEFEAAKRIAEAAEICSGAKDRDGNSVRSSAFWQCGGPTERALMAAQYLREVRMICGQAGAYAIVRCVVDGAPGYEREAREGLRALSEFWRL